MTANQLHGRLLDPADALRFLVAFAELDLRHAPMRQLRLAARGVQLLANRETPGHYEEPLAPDRAFLQEVQDRTRSLLQSLVTSGLAIEGDLVLAFFVSRGADGRVRVTVRGRLLDRVIYQLVRVATTGGADKLLACPAPDCGRLFLKVTKKRFCSQRCQSRMYMRKYRTQ